MRYQTFTVESRFAFPLDMLRYDSCFPATESDAGKIADSITQHEPVKVKIGRYVRTKAEQPTIRRWASFSCKLHDIHTR